MAELNITNIPAPRVPFIDERTGLMAREWYRFFLNLFVLTGSGGNPTTLDDVQLGPPNQPDLTELLTQINQNIAPQYKDQSGDFLATLDTAQLMSMMARFENAEAAIQGAYLNPIVQTGTIASYNLDGSPTLGGVAYGTGPALAVSAAGTSGQVLTSAGAAAPTWATPTTGTVTSVGATSPLSSTGGPTPVISITSPFPVANGGTGASSFTANYSLWGNGTSAVQADVGFVRTGAAGRYLFGSPTDDGTSKVQVKGPTKLYNAGGAYALIDGPSVTSNTALSFTSGGGQGILFLGSDSSSTDGGTIQINAGSTTAAAAAGGGFAAVAGNAIGAGTTGGGVDFLAGDASGVGSVGGSINFLAGVGTAGSGNIVLTDTLSTNSATFAPATGTFVAPSIESTDTTDASSTTTGALKTAGGLGVAKALWVGGLANIAGAVTMQSTINVTGVATLTAQPILSSLTASQAVFSDGSKGLVSNAITGSGSVVMSTNAILVTPNIGTPSAGVATNLTGTAAGLTAGTASAVAVGGITGLGTGVATALAVNVGSAGSPVVNGGALGTPSSGTVTNLTGTGSININGTVGATTANTGAFTTITATSIKFGSGAVLSSYEEGTWTPTGNGVSLTVGVARYVKVGNLVTVAFDVTWPATANGSAANIGGLPFNPVTAGGVAIGYMTASLELHFNAGSGAASLNVYLNNGSSPTNLQLSTSRIIASCSYLTT